MAIPTRVANAVPLHPRYKRGRVGVVWLSIIAAQSFKEGLGCSYTSILLIFAAHSYRNNVVAHFFQIPESNSSGLSLLIFTFSKRNSMLLLQDISFGYPNQSLLFQQSQLSVGSKEKIALVGNNGCGKSTLLKIAAGIMAPDTGTILRQGSHYYVPQQAEAPADQTVAAMLGIAEKLNALQAILNGDAEEIYFTQLADDWTIEERCQQAFHYWGLEAIRLDQQFGTLSGGQRTKVLLAGMQIHEPDLILMDEPSNHLDSDTRILLYSFIQQRKTAFVIVSHDRGLLQLTEKTYELSSQGLKAYGGNYEFYKEQKAIELHALRESLTETEKSIRKAKAIERETIERQQRLDARGKKKQEKAGVAKIMMNTLRNQAEQSTAKLKNAHAEKQQGLQAELQELRASLPGADKIRLGFEDMNLHLGKQLIQLNKVNHNYGNGLVWKQAINFQLLSGARWAIKGVNGSGKTTLLNILLGNLIPSEGAVERSVPTAVYLDQHYALLDSVKNLYEQVQSCNGLGLQEHELKNRLNRFLFTKDDWDKPCGVLSGGERMRLGLCCLSLSKEAPDLIVLDEPTNNLDLQNIGILTAAIADYKGTLLVVSHDKQFLEDIGIQHFLDL